MTFEEAWKYLVGEQPDTPATDQLRKLTLAFYKAGEVQGIDNAHRIITAGIEAGVVTVKGEKEATRQ